MGTMKMWKDLGVGDRFLTPDGCVMTVLSELERGDVRKLLVGCALSSVPEMQAGVPREDLGRTLYRVAS